MLVDATHPYAATHLGQCGGSRGQRSIPIVALRRPAWTAVTGDRWTEAAGCRRCRSALGNAPRRVFLAIGRKEVAAFAAAPQHHYLIRSVDPVDPPLDVPHAVYLVARGPFREADERALLKQHRIEVRRRQEQRRRRHLRQDRCGARAGHRRHHAAPADFARSAGSRNRAGCGPPARSCPRAFRGARAYKPAAPVPAARSPASARSRR